MLKGYFSSQEPIKSLNARFVTPAECVHVDLTAAEPRPVCLSPLLSTRRTRSSRGRPEVSSLRAADVTRAARLAFFAAKRLSAAPRVAGGSREPAPLARAGRVVARGRFFFFKLAMMASATTTRRTRARLLALVLFLAASSTPARAADLSTARWDDDAPWAEPKPPLVPGECDEASRARARALGLRRKAAVRTSAAAARDAGGVLVQDVPRSRVRRRGDRDDRPERAVVGRETPRERRMRPTLRRRRVDAAPVADGPHGGLSRGDEPVRGRRGRGRGRDDESHDVRAELGVLVPAAAGGRVCDSKVPARRRVRERDRGAANRRRRRPRSIRRGGVLRRDGLERDRRVRDGEQSAYHRDGEVVRRERERNRGREHAQHVHEGRLRGARRRHRRDLADTRGIRTRLDPRSVSAGATTAESSTFTGATRRTRS